jgi:hypothetical protein
LLWVLGFIYGGPQEGIYILANLFVFVTGPLYFVGLIGFNYIFLIFFIFR